MANAEYMSGLYAVVFEQGTVKIGMSHKNPADRITQHRNLGRRFGIAVAHEFFAIFEQAKDLPFRETVLANMCASVAGWSNGYEWFKFSTAADAVQHIDGFLERIRNNDYHGFTRRSSNPNGDQDGRKNHALLLVQLGGEPKKVCEMLGMDTRHLTSSKGFHCWKHQQMEVRQ